MEATVSISGSNQESMKSILIAGIKNMNRAIDGDIVYVEILPEEMVFYEYWCYASAC
jgi:exoribonuclease R